MTRSVKWLVAVLILITAASVVTVVFMAAHRPDTDEDEEEAVQVPSHVSVQNGRTVIRLNPQTQAREGIQTAPLRETSMRAQLRATAVILPVNDLSTLRNGYVAARTKVQRDQVDFKFSQSQYDRTRALYQQNQNMSLQEMQNAEAAYRGNQVQLEADQQNASLQLDTVRQRWGSVVADWVAHTNPILESVLAQRSFLVQVTFPPGEVESPPATLSLTAPGNQIVSARRVSPVPQVNPQIQGISFLYLVSSRPGMAVGMNLVVFVPVGRMLQGTVVPQSTVVWWRGKAWAYEQTSPDTFTRREIPTANPLSEGYFVPGHIFAPGTRLVVTGAQALLSEEFRSQIQEED